MLHEAATFVGYAVFVVGATLASVALVGGLSWWLAQKCVEQWTSMDLFWSTCFEIARKRRAE